MIDDGLAGFSATATGCVGGRIRAGSDFVRARPFLQCFVELDPLAVDGRGFSRQRGCGFLETAELLFLWASELRFIVFSFLGVEQL